MSLSQRSLEQNSLGQNLAPQTAASASRSGTRTAGLLIAAMIGLVCLLKLVAIFILIPADRQLFDLGFSFDPYVHSLYEGKGFESCLPQACDHASRMPGIPYFLYALTPFTLSMRVAAIVKALLLSLGVILACRGLPERLTVKRSWHVAFYLFVGAFVLFGPNLIKHASVTHYEEGYVLELLAITALSLFTLLLSPLKDASLWRFAIPIVTASLAYLFKSSLIIVWFVTTAIVLYAAFAAHRKPLALCLALLALAAPVSWLTHNKETTGRASFMSSYDGENMFRGWNAHTLDLYPRCSLDILFEPIRLCEGKEIDVPKELGRPAFASEWEWNDDYKKRALVWIRSEPLAALKTFGVKLYSVLLSPRLIPYIMTDGGAGLKEKSRGRMEELIGSAWLIVGRLLEIAGLALSLMLLVKGDGRARLIAITALALTTAYATPYILGFGYERHFAIFVMLAAISDLFVFSEVVRLRGEPARA